MWEAIKRYLNGRHVMTVSDICKMQDHGLLEPRDARFLLLQMLPKSVVDQLPSKVKASPSAGEREG